MVTFSAGGEHRCGRPTPSCVLYGQPNDPAGACADTKGRDKNTSRDLDAERHNGEGSLNDERNRDHPHNRERLRAGVEHAEARVGIGRTRETHGKEVIDKFGATHERVAVYEA